MPGRKKTNKQVSALAVSLEKHQLTQNENNSSYYLLTCVILKVTLDKMQPQSCIGSCCTSRWFRAGPFLPTLPSNIGILFWQSNRSHHAVHRQHRPVLRGNTALKHMTFSALTTQGHKQLIFCYFAQLIYGLCNMGVIFINCWIGNNPISVFWLNLWDGASFHNPY